MRTQAERARVFRALHERPSYRWVRDAMPAKDLKEIFSAPRAP